MRAYEIKSTWLNKFSSTLSQRQVGLSLSAGGKANLTILSGKKIFAAFSHRAQKQPIHLG